MYRIELSPGEETVFRSIEELAVAIRRGVVTPRARIYHSAGGKWLPIQFHPHYKTAASMPLTKADLIAGPPLKPLSGLKLDQASEPELVLPAAPPPAFLNSSETPELEARPRQAKTSPKQPAPRRRQRSSAKPRRQLRIALVGALLIGGAQWVLSAPLFSRADAPVLIRAHRQLISTPIEAINQVSSPNSAGMIPVISDSPAASATPPLDVKEEGGSSSSVPSFGGTSIAVPDIEAEVDRTAPSVQVPADSTKSKVMRTILKAVSEEKGGPRPVQR